MRKESQNYQNMLQQSQQQFVTIDRKYAKAKRLVREYQQREADMVHREEFYIQLLQEKDTEYNSLVKRLKDRVIHLEQDLQETQRKAGLPIGLPYDSANLRLTPQMTRKTPPKRFQKLESGLSDTEISDLSPEPEDDKTATVERKVPLKDELDTAVPQHELLDTSASKAKIGIGAKRQLPTGKKSLSNSSSDCALNDSEEDGATESTYVSNMENGQQNGHYAVSRKQRVEAAAAPLYAQVHKDRDGSRNIDTNHNGNSNGNGATVTPHYVGHSTIPNIYKNTSEDTNMASSYNNDLNSSYDSILGSNDKLSDSGTNADSNWMYPSRRRIIKAPPSSFTEQLTQVLSERERYIIIHILLINFRRRQRIHCLYFISDDWAMVHRVTQVTTFLN